MPVHSLADSKLLNADERRTLILAIEEMKARGMPVPQGLDGKLHEKKLDWGLTPNGYFRKRNGKAFNPSPKHTAFIQCKSRFILLCAGRGSGKTTSGGQKALLKIMAGESGSVINPDFENFKYSTWPEFKEWIPWNMVVPSQRYRSQDSWQPHQPFTMVFMNGARAFCKGLKDPDSARGPNMNWLWYDEGGRDREGLGWKLAIGGVRIGNNPQAWVTSTPKGTDHWLYKFFVEQQIPEDALEAYKQAQTPEMADVPLVSTFFMSLEDNKENLDPAFYAQMLATYPPGWLRQQELEGKFIAEGGSLGSRAWFLGKLIPAAPVKVSKRVRYWDLAASEKKLTGKKSDDPDSTCGTKMSMEPGKFTIEDQISLQIAWADIKKLIIDTAKQDGSDVEIYIEQEPGSGGKNQVAELIAMPDLLPYTVRGHNPKTLGDKVMRAMPWFARAAEGMIYLVVGAWNQAFLDQVDGFPGTKHDDRVDSVSGCWAKLGNKVWKTIGFLKV